MGLLDPANWRGWSPRPSKKPSRTSADTEAPLGTRENPVPIYIAPAEQTHSYKTVNWTIYGATCAEVCNAFASQGWRVVGYDDLILILERPVGLTHPDD